MIILCLLFYITIYYIGISHILLRRSCLTGFSTLFLLSSLIFTTVLYEQNQKILKSVIIILNYSRKSSSLLSLKEAGSINGSRLIVLDDKVCF